MDHIGMIENKISHVTLKIRFSEMFPIIPTKTFVSCCVYAEIIFLFLTVISVVDCMAFPAFLFCTLLCKVS